MSGSSRTWNSASNTRRGGDHPSLGAREDVNAAVHCYGGVVMHDVINNRFARKAIEKAPTALSAVAAGAGAMPACSPPSR